MVPANDVRGGIEMGAAVRMKPAADRYPRQSSEAPEEVAAQRGLAALSDLASVDIETRFVGDLSRDLHSMFDPVTSATLPIYFGPLLGRLYLEGL